MNKLNPHISVDCVVFGFDGTTLKVLLIDREKMTHENPATSSDMLKLPGNLINDAESIDKSAYRVLQELTGLDKIFLKQFAVFSDPDRLKNETDLEWLRATTGLAIERVVTIAYYSLVKINESNSSENMDSKWVPVDELPHLIFDHNLIIQQALKEVRKELRTEPVGFELLPKKFTLRQLQNLYEEVLGNKLDNRNFRKRIGKLDYLVPTGDKETQVSHKPARMFKFDKKLFLKERKDAGFMI